LFILLQDPTLQPHQKVYIMAKVKQCANPACGKLLEPARYVPIFIGGRVYHRLSCFFEHQKIRKLILQQSQEKKE